MNFTQLYSLGLGGVVIFLLTYRVCHAIATYLLPHIDRIVTFFNLPHPRGRLAWIAPKSWLRFCLLTIYFGGTLVCNAVRVSSLLEASSRAGQICLANVVCLMACSQDLGAHLTGLSLDVFRSVHRALGLMALLQAFAHGLLHVTSEKVNLHDRSTVYGVVTLILFASLGLSSLFKAELYALFVKLHHLCAIALVFTSWQHIQSPAPSQWYIIAGTVVYAATAIFQILRAVFRNFSLTRRAECLIAGKGNYYEILLFPARPWKVTAGQRINLIVPSVGLLSLFAMHPFAVVWWDTNETGTLDSITLLFEPRSAFTTKLKGLADTRHAAWIDGPYRPQRTANIVKSQPPDYGHVFMIATGFGIAAQIPYIKQVVESWLGGTARTQRIKLIWQLDKKGDYEGAKEWLQELIAKDSNKKFQVVIYDPTQPAASKPRFVGKHNMTEFRGGNVDWRDELKQEKLQQVGTMLITVSASMGVRNVFRRMVRKYCGDKVELLELEFQPWHKERSIWSYF